MDKIQDDLIIEIYKKIAHGFEGDREKNLPRIEPFVEYFSECNLVLDLGCGDGTMLELLMAIDIDSIGIDWDSNQIQKANARGLNAIHSDINEYLEKTDQNFDGIYIRHLIEHLDGYQATTLICNCFNVLNENGIVVLITPNIKVHEVLTHIFWLDISHKRPYPLLLLEKIFQEVGFQIIDSGYRITEPEKDTFIVGIKK